MSQARRDHLTAVAVDEGAEHVLVDGDTLTIDAILDVARRDALVRLPAHLPQVRSSQQMLAQMVESGLPVYGVTTGFGDSVRRQISGTRAPELQRRLIAFLGCGTGAEVPREIVRAVVLVRANSLVRGYSGVRRELIEGLVALLNHDVTPVIPQEGSVGASGDLVPLSYVAAVLTGERQAEVAGRRSSAVQALESVGLAPLELEPKEGLSLVNGTAYMTAIGALTVAGARRLVTLAEVNTALTTEVLCGITGPFAPFLHDTAKPHPGQVDSAAHVRELLEDSGLAVTYDDVVDGLGASDASYRELSAGIQEQYSIRCSPQFIGVLRDALTWVEEWLRVEVNSANDNPLVDIGTKAITSGGNFSGGHVALAMDALKTAVASVLDLMDRQLELVVDEKFSNGLTPNLIPVASENHDHAGLNHGFKGMQLACSSLTAEALSTCMPLTVFSRSTECHNQDKVSMGATAARQAHDVVALGEKVAVIQLLALCQAADLRGADRLGRTRAIYDRVRSVSPFVEVDRPLDRDIAAVLDLLHADGLVGTGRIDRGQLGRAG